MLYGREGEQAAVEALLTGARAGRSGVLVLRGEPGIGKTALLDHAVRAAAPDFRVVRATGVEYEADLPFAGLNLLLSPALDRLPGLPAPQRRALERAFGLSDEPAAPAAAPDRLLAGLATLTLLADLAEKQPLLCVVDDAQWLDRASAEALLLAARRLQAEGVLLLFGARDGEGAWSAPGLPELRLGALSAEAARALLAERAAGLSDHARSRMLAQAHGNPLALSELPTAAGPEADAGAGTVPLTGQLQLAYHGQVSRLPAATQTLLLVAAAEETGDLDVVLRAAVGLGAAAEDLRAAEQAELVGTVPSDAGQRLVFRHPLLRSAVLQRAPLAQRLAAHRALAEALAALPVPDAEGRRAWHLALAATGPDEPTAAALERAAEQAARRGGHAGAASAYERSARLTPERETATRRYTYAAEAAVEAGETDRAAELAARTLRRLAPEGGPGGAGDRLRRAQLLLVQATTQFWRGSDQGAFDLLLRTADLAADVAPEHLTRVLMQAFHVAWYLGEQPVGEVVDRLGALEEPPGTGGSHPTAAQAGYLVAVVGSLLGRSDRPVPPVADTVARARAAGAAVPVDLVTVCGATLIMGRDDETLRLAEELVAEARAVGTVGALPTLLFFLAEAELFQGRPGEALAHATESLRIAEDTGQPHWTGQLHSFLAHLAALRGDEPSARRSADAADAAGLAGRPWSQWSLGLLDLGLGRAEECLARLEPLVHGPQRHHVAGLRAVPDLVEAAVRLREPERAAGPFDYFRRWSARTGQPWTEALVLRCEALLGEDADAEERFTAAMRRHEEQDRPWDRARTALLHGEWLRRGRRKAEARGPLLAAESAFDRLGAAPWAERARSELGATGAAAPQGRARSGPLASLTPQESQIVRLAAQGLSNRDIAAQLFLSSRTVGYHLYKAYPKLGVASRGELAELL